MNIGRTSYVKMPQNHFFIISAISNARKNGTMRSCCFFDSIIRDRALKCEKTNNPILTNLRTWKILHFLSRPIRILKSCTLFIKIHWNMILNLLINTLMIFLLKISYSIMVEKSIFLVGMKLTSYTCIHQSALECT